MFLIENPAVGKANASPYGKPSADLSATTTIDDKNINDTWLDTPGGYIRGHMENTIL